MSNKSGKFSWSRLPEGAEEVLGSDFWNDFQQFFPKKGPHIDLYETSEEGIVFVELPGLESVDHFKITHRGTHLIIEGVIPDFLKTQTKSIIMQERLTGPFKRELHIPFAFSTNDIHAKFRHGLLEIRLKKITNEQKIDINYE